MRSEEKKKKKCKTKNFVINFRQEKQKYLALKTTLGQKKLVFVDQIPSPEGDDDASIIKYKKMILDVIVNNRLFRDQQLEVLFYELKMRNNDVLSEDKLDEVILGIKDYLEN